MNYEEEKKRNISFCGSYCHTCDWFTGKIRKTFQSALDMVQEYGFKRLLEGQAEKDNLVKGLEVLSQAIICSGCKAEIAESPKEDRCQIRQCASSRGFELCSQCSDFPCDVLKSNPGLLKFRCIENLKEIQKNGLDRWIDRRWAAFAKEEK